MPWETSNWQRPPNWAALKREMFRLKGRRCVLCGDRANQADHIVPQHLGGPDTVENLQPLCEQHHRARSSSQGGTARAKRYKRRQPKHPGLRP